MDERAAATNPARLVAEFVDLYLAGESPSPLEFAARAGADADEVASLIEDFLFIARNVEPTPEATERARSELAALTAGEFAEPLDVVSRIGELRDKWVTASRQTLARLAESLTASGIGLVLSPNVAVSRGSVRSSGGTKRFNLGGLGYNVDRSADGSLALSITGLADFAGCEVSVAFLAARDPEAPAFEWAQDPPGLIAGATVTDNGILRAPIGRLTDPEADPAVVLSGVYLWLEPAGGRTSGPASTP